MLGGWGGGVGDGGGGDGEGVTFLKQQLELKPCPDSKPRAAPLLSRAAQTGLRHVSREGTGGEGAECGVVCTSSLGTPSLGGPEGPQPPPTGPLHILTAPLRACGTPSS